MEENIVLYSQTNFFDVDKLFRVGGAKNMHVWTDLESTLQRQKDECFLKDKEEIGKLEDYEKLELDNFCFRVYVQGDCSPSFPPGSPATIVPMLTS